MDEGDVLEVTASHDTYSISFALSPQDAPAQPTQDGLQDLDTAGPAPASTAVPLKVCCRSLPSSQSVHPD